MNFIEFEKAYDNTKRTNVMSAGIGLHTNYVDVIKNEQQNNE
jgi:hypothetical protein